MLMLASPGMVGNANDDANKYAREGFMLLLLVRTTTGYDSITSEASDRSLPNVVVWLTFTLNPILSSRYHCIKYTVIEGLEFDLVLSYER